MHPVGFLVVQGETVRLLSAERGDFVETLLNTVPQVLDQIQELWPNRGRNASAFVSPEEGPS